MPNEGNAANAVNTANAASLKRQRATIKACCTRTQTYVESIGAFNSSVKAQLEERKAKLEYYWTEYNGIQSELEFLDANEVSDRDGFEKAYYALAAKIRELLNPPVSPTRTSASPSPSTSTFPSASESSFHVRLPKLNLPKFSGKYDEWFPFHDAFNSIIHANPSINNIQRLQYLRGCLSGEASDVVSSLEISELNYEVAWRLSRERYDNKKVIVQTHIRAIVELPAMTKENGFELRQIADGATKHINALQALKRPTAHWDDILIYILSTKLDPITLREWQISLTGTELPTMKQLLEFITHKYQVLEATGKSAINTRSKSSAKQESACHATLKYKCSYCNGDHSVFRCKDFLAFSISRRKSEIRSRGLCMNCLRSTAHQANQCTTGSCKSCKGKHNTLLHVPTESESQDSEKKQNETSGTKDASTMATHTKSSGSGYVMLSTAIVNVTDNKNALREARVLLDCGSQANFVSRQFLDTLGLKARSLNISISGVNGAVSQSTHIVSLKLQSRLNSYSICLDCIVADRVTEALPGVDLKQSTFDLPRNINLADPQFHRSSKVDILVGAEAFWELLCVGQIKSSSRHPTLQKTRLGWILAGRLGKLSNSAQRTHALHASVTNMQLHEELVRFWHQEEVSNRANYTMEEAYCEQHFIENVAQAKGGKLIVKLPVKEQLINRIGSSREIALKRFLNLEKRFKRDPLLKLQYSRFMEEYLSLGHMQRVNVAAQDDSVSFYLPHHCVYKHAERSKLRVVFDASCKSSTGISLNDALCTGPVVQQDLMSILMRFRTFAYVLVADVVKMYRQVLIHPSQTSLQRILWRNDTESEIDTFELITVTYGTSSASFLATRCFNYLANLHAEKYPIGSKCIQRDFYVDDLLTGADTLEDSKLVRDEIIKLLELGSFKLSKWASNLPELLKEVGERCVSPVTISDGAHSRILSIQWDQSADAFLFSYELQEDTSIVSKRIILSNVAKLFDPLGLLGPIVVTAKLILQELWQAGSQWDESVPQNIHSRWLNFKSRLPELNQLQISRRVKFEVDPQLIQIHGFCDASQRAYGACVYVRTIMGADESHTSLLCSKSRVAPLKAVTLPRLELSAAVLLAQLINKVAESIDTSKTRIFLWSDSTIALNWITSPSRRWSIFVSHRVGEIQRLTQLDSWRHVSSSDNPADILSRGIDPQELLNASLWWQGPTFLRLSENNWPNHQFAKLEDELPEKREIAATVVTLERSVINELFKTHSNLNKICRIIAYCLRFSKVLRPTTPSVFVSPIEITRALNVACREVQKSAFAKEYGALSKGTPINNSSKLLSLSPFIDKTGLIRVGGRLGNSEIPYDARHPVLLPRDHDLTKYLIYEEHIRNLHAGTQTTMSAVRQRFWPLALRSTTRKIIRNCVICFKARPIQSEAIMGSLPSGRVTISRPFSHCGVDYAGPIILGEGKRRNARNHKAYISVFVCFATKAVHLELVSDLTSEAFIAAFKRFIARRGKPVAMYSDNGTTFVGAHKQLKEFYDLINSERTQTIVKEFLREKEVSWCFIPPNAPHFGGLWEAAVKSAKTHMTRIVGTAHLKFEELQTVLSEIEAVLNSRPLTQLSNDPNDPTFLSPGHFLIGAAMNSTPCRDLHDVNENRLTRWERVEQIRQHFWRKWSSEYLHTLQEKTKWRVNKGEQLKPGQLVLVKQQGLAPLQWLVGRVQEIHPGSDGVARTATVQTPKGSFVRPLAKLAILPYIRKIRLANFKF